MLVAPFNDIIQMNCPTSLKLFLQPSMRNFIILLQLSSYGDISGSLPLRNMHCGPKEAEKYCPNSTINSVFQLIETSSNLFLPAIWMCFTKIASWLTSPNIGSHDQFQEAERTVLFCGTKRFGMTLKIRIFSFLMVFWRETFSYNWLSFFSWNEDAAMVWRSTLIKGCNNRKGTKSWYPPPPLAKKFD